MRVVDVPTTVEVERFEDVPEYYQVAVPVRVEVQVPQYVEKVVEVPVERIVEKIVEIPEPYEVVKVRP